MTVEQAHADLRFAVMVTRRIERLTSGWVPPSNWLLVEACAITLDMAVAAASDARRAAR